MHEAAVTEFPFVAALPKREQSKIGSLWDRLKECEAAVKAHGMLLPQRYVADLLGVTPQRINQLVNEGRLLSVDIGGVRLVSEDSVVAWAKVAHTCGDRIKPSVGRTFKNAFKKSVKTS